MLVKELLGIVNAEVIYCGIIHLPGHVSPNFESACHNSSTIVVGFVLNEGQRHSLFFSINTEIGSL